MNGSDLPPMRVNGRPLPLPPDPLRRLSEVLRDEAGLTGTKTGCDAGDCGACTVLLDGRPVCACLTPVARAAGAEVTTVEGLARGGVLDRLQASFLRHGAAQCGICTPGMLMAATALLAQNPRPTEAEAERALAGVLCRCTGYRRILAAVCDAGRRDAPDPPPPRTPPGVLAGVLAVGRALPRLDGPEKLTGAERFGADPRVEGALQLFAVRAPMAAAGVRLGDISAWAAARPGVLRVFTAADVPGVNRHGVIPDFADQPMLAEGRIRFRGEAVALIACTGGTVPGLADFPVTYAPAPALEDIARAADAPLLHADRPGNLLIEGRVRRGDAAAALAGSAHVVSDSFETAHVEHAYVEPEAASAWMEGDVLCIRAATQAPMMNRDGVAGLLGLPVGRVRIIPAAVGGGFGGKLDLSVQPLVGLATLLTGRPSRMVWSRGESMRASTKRHPARMRMQLGCDAEGRITALDFEGDFDTGPYASWGPTVANRVPVHVSGPYRTPAIRARARAIHSNNPVAGAFRGFGVPQAALAQEVLYDRLAAACRLDRLEFRLRNAFRPGDATATGQVLATTGILACLTALRPHWQRALAEAERADAAAGAAGQPRRRGVGIASCWYGCGNTALPNPSTVRLGLTAAGRIVLHRGAIDMGQGAATVIAQICADALGLPLAELDFIDADTALTPDAGKTSASRQTFVTGRAAEAAGRRLRRLILRAAGVNDGAGVSLSLAGGLVAIHGTTRHRLDPARLPAGPSGYVLLAEETYDPPTSPLDADGQGAPYAVYGYGAQIAEVEVDLRLGTTRVLKVTAAHDLGRAINPQLAMGQIEGGVAQGIGMALMEEYLSGVTENLHDYLIPTIGDVPPIESLLIETPDPEGPSGARGLGEHVLIPTAPALVNAIAHATGTRPTRLPVLPHRLRAAIAAAEGERG